MRLTSKPLAVIVLAAIFGGISLSTWLGWWQTESSKQPQKFEEGTFAGDYNPADIRGSYTFGDISTLFDIPLEDLQQAFLPEMDDLSAIKVSELEAIYSEAAAAGQEIGTGSIRLFVAYYKGLPFTTNEEYLPAAAIEILYQTSRLDPPQIAYLESHSVELQTAAVVENEVIEPTPLAEEHIPATDTTIKGKTTFRELLDWGLTKEQIESVIGAELPNPLVVIKDYCLEEGLEFGEIKLQFEELLPESALD